MVKQRFVLMSKFFTRERFGEPQVIAAGLLLVFLAQCLWLVAMDVRSGRLNPDEQSRIEIGLRQWHSLLRPLPTAASSQDYDPNHSALFYLTSSAPLLILPDPLEPDSSAYRGWLARAPFLTFGVLLGASLWYVSRRLYGNAGGYIALALYCFSPGVIRSSAIWFAPPETGAAWGAFGAIFTAIAVSHTLYAPREVVLWNWRRILLLGISLALAVGFQFGLVVLMPLVVGFLLYLAPTRRQAAVVIWAAGCSVAFILLYASYFFRPRPFWEGMRHARWLDLTGQGFLMRPVYLEVARAISRACPALLVLLPVALATWVMWRRSRYFGNTVPLLLALLFIGLGIASPHIPGGSFHLTAVTFLFVFVAGICADLLETRHRPLVMACLWGLFVAYAIRSLMELAWVSRA